MKENYELVMKGFTLLQPVLAGYIGQEFSRKYGENWWTVVLDTLDDQKDLREGGSYAELVDSLDIANCLRLIDRKWNDLFHLRLSKDCRTWAKELMGVRNRVSHIGSEDLKQRYAVRALDTMALLCEFMDVDSSEEIRALYRKALYGSEAGSTAVELESDSGEKKPASKSAGVLKSAVGTEKDLPSWRDVMQPHPDVAAGRYRTAEFAADLAQVARGEGSIEYRDPVEFFSRTYITEGMQGLLVQALQRITGQGGEPVVQLKTAFGGGKTHSMLALYHMVRGTVKLDKVPNLKPVVERAGLTELPRANVAVLVGTSMDPARAKKPSNLPGRSVNTVWGEMAYQLVTSAGKPELYDKYVRDADRKGVSPGSENLKNLLDDCGPCVVLMDELVAYAKKLYKVEGLPAGSFDNFITFIQEITEAARASRNSIVVASIPESDREIGGDAGQIALDSIQHTFGRMESVWKPVAANEGFEVVRRRLFLPCRDEAARDRVCDAFSRMYQDNNADFPPETKEVDYRDRLVSCYPIHPEVFDRLYKDWASLEKFQRTRGVLRLMSAVIHELWTAGDASAMIMPGSIPLDMPDVRDELTRYLEENWNSIIDSEVDGKESIPFKKDKEIPRYGKDLACRRVARTIMLGSAPTSKDTHVHGLEISRIRLGVVQPGESISVFNDALGTLHNSLTFLYSDTNGNRYWYDTHPTLKKTAEDRATQISLDEVDYEIESRVKKLRREKPFAGIHACPASSFDVPDEQSVRLVILGPEHTYNSRSEEPKALKAAADILNNRGTSPRIYRNMLAFLAPDSRNLESLRSEVRNYLAWLSIQNDTEVLNLETNQIHEVENRLKRSNETVKLRINETWCWLLVPYIDPVVDLKTIQWMIGNIGGGTESVIMKAAKRMEQEEQLIVEWAPNLLKMQLDDLLWRDQNDIEVKKLWEYLSTYCYLPRLADYSVLENTILRGLGTEDYFAVADTYDTAKGRYVNLRLGKPVSYLNKTDLLVKTEPAREQIKREKPKPEPHPDPNPRPGPHPGPNPVPEPHPGPITPEPVKGPSHFSMHADLDYTRVNREVNNCIQEIVQHLYNLNGSKVKLELNVEVEVPDGIPGNVVRTVSENCKTMKMEFEFDQ